MEKYELNKSLAQMLKGGVIMDVTNVEQAKIAEAAGACAVMALERVPSGKMSRFLPCFSLRALSLSICTLPSLVSRSKWIVPMSCAHRPSSGMLSFSFLEMNARGIGQLATIGAGSSVP